MIDFSLLLFYWLRKTAEMKTTTSYSKEKRGVPKIIFYDFRNTSLNLLLKILHNSFKHLFHFVSGKMDNHWSPMWTCKWMFGVL